MKLFKKLKEKKGASLLELLLITGAIMLITAMGMKMFKGSFNSVSQTVNQEIQNAHNIYNGG